MRSLKLLTISLLSIIFIAACSGIETRPGDTDAFVAGNYQYYRWRSEPMQNTLNSVDPMYQLDPILRRELDRALQAKGYKLDSERAQFSVDYIYAEGLRMGEKSRDASNLSTHPGTIPNRNMDQASVDNAYALGGVKETANIGIQFNDVERKEEVWRVIITKIIDNVNANENLKLQKNVEKAVQQATRELPKVSP
ncbi:MAG: DUF4136 domain-containing protein [Halioglobus sp.]